MSELKARKTAAHQFVAVNVHGIVAFTILQSVAAEVVCSGNVVLGKSGRLNHEPFGEDEDLGLWFCSVSSFTSFINIIVISQTDR